VTIAVALAKIITHFDGRQTSVEYLMLIRFIVRIDLDKKK
jgi:hypothetical protein